MMYIEGMPNGMPSCFSHADYVEIRRRTHRKLTCVGSAADAYFDTSKLDISRSLLRDLR